MAQYKYHDEDWLLEALASNTPAEIADECGVKTETVEKWIDKHGIQELDPTEESPVEAGEHSAADDDSSESLESDGESTVQSESQKVRAHTVDKDFPKRAELCGVGECRCCGSERMLAKQHLGGDTVGVCAICFDKLLGLTVNSKRSVIDNPSIPREELRE